MKSIKILSITIILAVMTSCSETIKFPVSKIVPAADISAEVKEQGDPNYLVTIEANNLASPERLEPPKKLYVIWAVSESGVVRNVGHFNQENAEKSTYKASFPYKPIEVFITAENEEGNCLPTGTEITRATLIKD
ncbi:hypothetical protein LB467_06295 [Salegentibacter sp. JZCK2]|uniref:hypothetical protein n=1 Tax=Salegentibacter tibetensis TaxID=2873600 RepID=UPI001CCA506F|nr:hypothetical protein [Salegentibacter tibetensis]MBZ9729292.1 hypothetical protein [Salegentibacter tibetensis]